MTRDSLFPPQQLKVSPSDGRDRDFIPGKTFNMKIRGDPGSKVGLVAIDNAVYLLNKDKLTQRKVCVFKWGSEGGKKRSDYLQWVL